MAGFGASGGRCGGGRVVWPAVASREGCLSAEGGRARCPLEEAGNGRNEQNRDWNRARRHRSLPRKERLLYKFRYRAGTARDCGYGVGCGMSPDFWMRELSLSPRGSQGGCARQGHLRAEGGGNVFRLPMTERLDAADVGSVTGNEAYCTLPAAFSNTTSDSTPVSTVAGWWEQKPMPT